MPRYSTTALGRVGGRTPTSWSTGVQPDIPRPAAVATSLAEPQTPLGRAGMGSYDNFGPGSADGAPSNAADNANPSAGDVGKAAMNAASIAFGGPLGLVGLGYGVATNSKSLSFSDAVKGVLGGVFSGDTAPDPSPAPAAPSPDSVTPIDGMGNAIGPSTSFSGEGGFTGDGVTGSSQGSLGGMGKGDSINGDNLGGDPGGSTGGSVGCFITTAVCATHGWPDDCRPLTLLRSFRDSYMLADPERRAEVARYYRDAPGIVARIDARPDATAVYRDLWRRWLVPALASIAAGKPERARQIYRSMVTTLAKRA